MAKAAASARRHGGVESARMFTHVWLAMVGRWDWQKLPAIPPELVFLPSDWPLSIWSFACWARQTIVALSVISAHRPAHPLPFEIEELKSGKQPRGRRLNALGVALVALDKALHYYESLSDQWWPKRVIRGAALREAERWIVARQEADGSWGGIQPPMVYSTIALVLQGYPLDHPVIAAALRGLDAFAVDDESGRRIEACQSPVWDTALAVTALLDAGTAHDDPSIKMARDWLVQREVTVVGDWSVRRPGLAPGGWAFEFQNVHYPDIDDTAEVVIALRRGAGGPDGEGACRRAVNWLVGMQCKDGGWAAFDADNTSELPTQLPFFDFGVVTDPPTADVTAHVVEMLAAEMLAVENRPPEWREAMQKGLDWLGRAPGARRLLLGTLGRQLHIRHGRGPTGPRRRRRTGQRSPSGGRGAVVDRTPEPRRRLGRGPALLRRAGLARPGGVHRFPDRLGAARPPGGRGTRKPGHQKRCRVARGQPDPRRDLGRALVHRHRVPVGLFPELPPLPPRLPAHCAGPLPLRYGPPPQGCKAITG